MSRLYDFFGVYSLTTLVKSAHGNSGEGNGPKNSGQGSGKNDHNDLRLDFAGKTPAG
jgi:hypothetical protein|tara:strand:- start:184 stop:354 length:171 start_codon:yes stop_codon:yes gene_type:complete